MPEHRRKHSNDDKLYSWKKHSGFKMGLLTDIVMGDEHKFSGPSQYRSTMHADYTGHLLATPENSLPKPPSADLSGPAGKSLGFTSSKKSEIHIVFGDPKMVSDERKHSMTDSDFKAHTISNDKQFIVKPGVSNNQYENNLTPAQMFHTKSITATSAAHIGLQTRQDLPIDDKHFRNFITTTQEAYVPKDANDIDLRTERASRAAMGRPSNIHLGDLEKQKSYDTVQGMSFIRHASEYYRPYEGHHKPKPTSIRLGHNDKGSSYNDQAYVTTTAAAYLAAASDASRTPAKKEPSTFVRQQGGASHIAFGEEEQERRKTNESVTQKDYMKHNEVGKVPIKFSQHPNSQGIIKALAPDEAKRDCESYTISSYKGYSNNDIPVTKAAGFATSSASHLYGGISSVPTGDQRHYDFKYNGTTTGDAFPPHRLTELPAHPVLGASITKSKIEFGDLQDSQLAQEQYVSTAQMAFVQYSEEEARKVRGVRIPPHPSMQVGESVEEAYSMDHHKTTQQAHFQAPENPARRRHAKAPRLAGKNILFPIRTTQHPFPETTAQDYYSMRDGLLKREPSKHRQKGTRESSIVFGDPKYSYFQPMPTIAK